LRALRWSQRPAAGGRLQGINDRGQIAGTAIDENTDAASIENDCRP
jgi:hypothetical protein